jgi:hypothetical protein
VSQRDGLVSRLLQRPGDGKRESDKLLSRAAEAHRTLLRCAASEATATCTAADVLRSICTLLERSSVRGVARRFLVDPAFVEGLHRAAGVSRTLADWHRAVAEPSIASVCPPADAESAHRLGNSLLPLLLRDDPRWLGQIALRTDVYGRLRFPLSDWSLVLCGADGPGCVLSDELVYASLMRHEVRLSTAAPDERELLSMPRDAWLRAIVGNDPQLDGRQIHFAKSDVTTRLQFAGAIPGWRVRYEPVTFGDEEGYSALTGGVVTAILNAIARHSPAIRSEFNSLMSVVRGWELLAADYGTIQSFSDPTLPRVMGMNVTYAADHEPQICPLCFTWFGHELGHTKSYLIETILHVRGEALTTNQSECTDVIERYGRALSFRTLLQVPYTHLYEWTLLMDFLDGRFSGLPWEITDDPIAFGDDIHSEIVEAFTRIERGSQLTPCGAAAMSRLHSLCSEAQVRWQALRAKVALSPSGWAHVEDDPPWRTAEPLGR